MFKRKPNNGLSRKDVIALSDGNHRANTMRCPLNVLLTARTCRVRALALERLCAEFIRIRNNYDGFARRRGFAPAHVWTRECYPDGTGEHMHMLCHVPAKLFAQFRRLAFAWMPCPKEVSVRKAGIREYQARDGKRHSSLFYIAKQMTPQAVFRTDLRRMKGGTIWGKRWNASRNLLPPKPKD